MHAWTSMATETVIHPSTSLAAVTATFAAK
jgi:hypothetical protein